MAHLRAHDNSKFWYVRFRDLDTGIWREESTRLLKDDQQQTRAAQRIADKKTRQESQLSATGAGMFRDWVQNYIEEHYTRESTRRRSLNAWTRLAEWLNAQGLRHPREIRYEHAKQYIKWRKDGGTSHNTALHEIHFLAFILQEAIRLEYLERNVLAKLGIGREPAAEKPELTNDQINAARVAFAVPNRAWWMRVACEIQIFTGCRISETSIAMSDVNFDAEEITITDAKRKLTDPHKRYTVDMDPMLAVTLRPLIGKERTVPVFTREMEGRYNYVLKSATGTTSHSFRVTFITRLWHAGVPEREAMRLVNHSRKEVHAIYSRPDPASLRAARRKLVLPPPLNIAVPIE
jgi:hypothetical protein